MNRQGTNIKRFESDMVRQKYVSDLGMSLELYISKDGGEIQDGIPYPLLKVIADERSQK